MWLGLYLSTDEIVGQVVDENLKPVSLKRRPIITNTPKSGYAEQDPEEWWNTLIVVVREIVHELKGKKIKAISVTSQREGLVFVDKNGEPLGKCIIWMDTRALKESEYLKRRIGKNTIYNLTGLPIDATFSFPRLLWVKEHTQILTKTKYYLQPKDYIIYKLTGKFSTDPSLACRTLLYDIKRLEWIDEFFKDFHIPNLFPPIIKSTDIVGFLKDEVAEKLGIEKGLPIVEGGGDRPVQMLAAGAKNTGEFIEHMSSVVNLSTALDSPKLFEDSKIGVGLHVMERKWLAEASVSAGCLIFNWLKTFLGIEKEDNLIDYNVSQVPPACEGLIFIPHLQGARAPWWTAYSKGTLYNMTLKHTKWYLLRAFMESVSYEIKLTLDMFKENKILPTEIVCLEKMDKLKIWHIIKSSCINFPYTFINLEEPTSFGAALLAMYGYGQKDLIDEWIKNRNLSMIEPKKELTKVYEKSLTKYVKTVKIALNYYRKETL
ncbi:MAG: FGGY family carbohydrate kinase [Nitrososphaeria archaeon]|nr:FGGY family carbohydrate kinase [Nitrososphaeria archaeon]